MAAVTSPVLSDRAALEAAIKADPADVALLSALADLITEQAGDYAAAVAAVELLALDATVHGRGRKAAGYRGEIARLCGATRSDGRPISCLSIRIVAGDAAPEYHGTTWHYETKTGVVVRHPNAYRKVAKSAELVYCPASHVVTVGADWVRANVL